MYSNKIGISFSPFGKTYGRYGNDKYSVLRQHGYRAIDLNLSDTNIEWYHMDEDGLRQTLNAEKTAAQAADILISQVHGPWRWPSHDGTATEREERMEKMKKAVIITALLGCRYLVIHPIMPYGVEDIALGKAEQTWQLNVSFFKKLVAFATLYDVIICLENMPMRKFSISTPQQILALAKEINDEHLRICLDTGHVSVFATLSVGEEIRRLGEYIKVFHIHDNDGSRDAHLCPGEGRVDWSDFARATREIGFGGVLSLETAPSGEYDDARFAQHSQALYQRFCELMHCGDKRR